MSKRNAVIDLDGVIYDLNGAIESRLHDKYPNYSSNRILTYDYNKSLDFSSKGVPEWFINSIDDSVGDFGLNANRSDIFKLFEDVSVFKDAKIYDGVLDGLITLSKHYNIIFNSFAFNSEVAGYKMDRLQSDFNGKFEFSMVTSVGVSKPALLGTDLVVEDNIGDLAAYLIEGMHPRMYLIDKSYNSDLNNLDASVVLGNSIRVKNFKQINEYESCRG